ncbi:MAG: class I SAM-dependent methyltransferase, partial [Thermoplasmata archaeon]|nr:class I SAM-dependent methyltransferase [Thermoplasmata archaeon]
QRLLDRMVPSSLRDSPRLSRWLVGSRKSYDELARLMRRYRVENLVGVGPEEFRTTLEGFVDGHDARGDGPVEVQRDLSVRFHWGHTHDFGTFQLSGRMGFRHLAVLSVFIDKLQAIPIALDHRKVLDIGCWTGGTSLLLAAMGAEVVAIEEANIYVKALAYQKLAFGVKELDPRSLSLYDLDAPEYQDAFDVALFSGVIYHLTDPVVGLRLVYNTLKEGGVCLVETAAKSSRASVCTYEGPSVVTRGNRRGRNRGGWNWFVPSRAALVHMMEDVGFTDVRAIRRIGGRVFAVGRRGRHVDMTRAGLSRPSLR